LLTPSARACGSLGWRRDIKAFVRSTLLLLSVLALVACHDYTQPAYEQLDAVGQPRVTLSPSEKTVTVPVGATLLYSFKSHGSVGYGAIEEIADSAVVAYVRTDMNYERPEPRPPGGDAATGVFVFEAVGPGTTTVKIDEQFRGTTEQSNTFTITVTAK
jgi:hypothetical protein